MTEAEKQAHKEILWRMRTGQGLTAIGEHRDIPESAVFQMKHKVYGKYTGEDDEKKNNNNDDSSNCPNSAGEG